MASGIVSGRSAVSGACGPDVLSGFDLWRLTGGPSWRQQLVDAALLPASGQFFQHVAHVRPRVDVVESAGSEDCIDDGRPPGALVRTGEEIILAAHGDLPEGSLAGVVVDLEGAILKEPRQSGPLV